MADPLYDVEKPAQLAQAVDDCAKKLGLSTQTSFETGKEYLKESSARFTKLYDRILRTLITDGPDKGKEVTTPYATLNILTRDVPEKPALVRPEKREDLKNQPSLQTVGWCQFKVVSDLHDSSTGIRKWLGFKW